MLGGGDLREDIQVAYECCPQEGIFDHLENRTSGSNCRKLLTHLNLQLRLRRGGSVATGAAGAVTATEAPLRSRIARNIFNRCPSETPGVFEMLIGQVWENGHFNVVPGKSFRILGHAEFF
jgi:hypothetical protein